MEDNTKSEGVNTKAGGAVVRMAKKLLMTLLLLLIGSLLLWVWYVRERIADIHLMDTMKEEVARVEGKLEERGNIIEDKLDLLDSKLDRVEGKLDRLLDLLEPRFPDGMSQVE